MPAERLARHDMRAFIQVKMPRHMGKPPAELDAAHLQDFNAHRCCFEFAKQVLLYRDDGEKRGAML